MFSELKLKDLGVAEEDVKAADEVASMIEFCTLHTADGKQFWAYVSIPPSKYQEYREKHAVSGGLNLYDFGEVLETGWGDEPSDEVRAEMKEKYGANPNFEKEFISAVETEVKKLQEQEFNQVS